MPRFVNDFLDFPVILGTQRMALQNFNRAEQGAGNDRQAVTSRISIP
jgi:hypothetical protein